jgi:fructokinase
MNQPTILALGEVLWDLFDEGQRLGGAPANFACHVALLRCEIAIVSAVGKDTRGAGSVALLECVGVSTSLIQHLPNLPTGTVGVHVDPLGLLRMIFTPMWLGTKSNGVRPLHHV